MTITEFLLAMIAGEEAEAHYWAKNYSPSHPTLTEPARVLAECQAKRAIVAEHAEQTGFFIGFRESDRLLAHAFDHESVPIQWSAEAVPTCLRHLAAVYATHPDYQQEWKP